MVDRKKLVYRTNEYTNSFKNFRAINTFGRNIYNSTITLKEVDKNQSSLSDEIMNSKSKIKPQNPEKKQIKKDILKNLYACFDGRERVFNPSESKIFLTKSSTGFSDLALVAKISDC